MSHFFRCLLAVAGAFLLAQHVQAQAVGYGDWQLHLPTNPPQRLADAGDRVYVAAQNAFYFFDKNLNTTQVLSRRDGLNDVGVAAVAYDSVTQQTVLAYRNTNIDILRPNGTVRNINDVLRKPIQGAKDVNDVSVADSKAYLATSFGIVVVDLVKLEITDTYSNIGPAGAIVNVYSVAVANGYVYAATSAGLLRGRSTSNLLDYRNWTVYLPAALGGPTQRSTYRLLATFNGQVYAGVEGSGLSLYKFVPTAGPNGAWQPVGNTYTVQFRALRASSTGLLIADNDYGVRRLDAAGTVRTVLPPSPSLILSDVLRARDGSYFLANGLLGLQRAHPGTAQATETFVANGPATSRVFSVLADARTNTVDVFTGSYSERYLPGDGTYGFYEYANNQWTNFTAQTYPQPADYPNPARPVRGARTPDGTLYVAHFAGGLLEWKGVKDFRQFGAGTPGTPLLGTFGIRDRVEITDLAATPEGKLWVVNRHLQPSLSGLFLFDPVATTWQTMPWSPGFEVLERITTDDVGNAWVSVSRKTDGTTGAPGIYAVDPTGANAPKFFSTSSGLPDNQIYDLVKDRRGYIWAATIKGVAVFNDPSGPFLSTIGFTQPRVERGEGTGFNTLYSEAVRAIAVDGGDRKWFGTDNGLWLFSPDANEALLHFTTANSPLPSNRIVDVEVNDKTGEVWVATDAGVVAYRGSATITEGKPSCAAVFPNPVRPDFQGTVGITGLANNATVKITDVAGHLVYATTAAGGTVTWNLTTPNGQRVRSGVYLVLSADADGKNGCVSKVAVVGK